ncbi:hypothetical protein BY458DRAFT_506006 [Sporodiniella umbellata]|nr:hypothetical protein BY458DRAFT_506006 [Sporodiniella umbellata]
MNPVLPLHSEPWIALVQRGGRCQLWSEKVGTIQSIAIEEHVEITALMIYDHHLYNDTVMAKQPPTETSVSNERNVSQMITENLLDRASTFLAVYYVPKLYIQQLNQTYLQIPNTWTQLVFNHPKDTSLNTKSKAIIYSIVVLVILLICLFILRQCFLQKRGEKKIASVDIHRCYPILHYFPERVMNASCPICLDDFHPHSSVRLLPCFHGYCVPCIDLWLTKKSSLCPLCKQECSIPA